MADLEKLVVLRDGTCGEQTRSDHKGTGRGLAHVLIETGAPADAISELIRHGREQVAQTGAHAIGPRFTEAEARLADRSGDLARCEQALREAERAFRAIGATPHADRLARELSP